MTLLLLLIPLSIGLLCAAVWAFIWAVRKGQFDDLDTPALDILRDDPAPRPAPVEQDTAASGSTGSDEDR